MKRSAPSLLITLSLGVIAAFSTCACSGNEPLEEATNSGGATATGGSPSSGGDSNNSSGAGGASTSGGASAAGGASGGAAGSGGAELGAGGSADGAGGADDGSGGAGSGGATVCAGNAVSFDANGTGTASDSAHARVMVDLMSDLPVQNANRTLEFWAYIRSSDWVGETNTIFEYGDQSKTAAGFGLDFGGNKGTIDPYTNGGFDNDNQATGLPTDVDQWVHFAMSWDGMAVRTYVNGEVKSTKMGGGTTMLATATTQLTIGCNNPRFSCFGGLIDEWRVWNVARSANEIMGSFDKGLVGDEAGLVAYLRFNEETDTTASDSVTSVGHSKHPGTLMSATPGQIPTFVASTVPITCP